jgi:hypothetical protein
MILSSSIGLLYFFKKPLRIACDLAFASIVIALRFARLSAFHSVTTVSATKMAETVTTAPMKYLNMIISSLYE